MNLNNKNIFGIALTLCLSFAGIQSKAQNQEKKKRFNEQVTIVGEYQPTIVDADKINVNPKLDEAKKVEVPESHFTLEAKPLNTSFELQAVKPLDIRFDKRTQTYNNFIKAGIGNYLNPYINAFHNGGNQKDFAYGLHFKHYSSNMEIEKIPESTFGNNLFEARVSKNFDEHTLNAKAYYQRRGLHYFGVFQKALSNEIVKLDSIRQVYNYIGANVDFANTPDDEEAFKYKLKASFNHTSDHFDASENNLNFALDLNKLFFLFDFSDGEKIGIKAENENYFYKREVVGGDNLKGSNLIRIKPYIQLQYDMFKLYGGVDLSFVSGDKSDFYFYPDLKADIEILPKQLVVYAGLKGGVTRNSLRSITLLNPYVSSNPLSTWTSDKIKFYGGVKGNVAESVDYNLELSYDSFDNFMLFAIDKTSYFESSLTPLYDKVNRFRIEGSLAYHLTDKITARGYYQLNSYSAKNFDEAYQSPKSTLGLEVMASPIKKLKLNLSIANRGKVPFLIYDNPTAPTGELDSWTDLGIGAEYDITETISAFVQGNNLLNHNYYMWQNYPVQGLNVMVGGSIRF
ncbi:MAG: hypothetical protein ACEPOW_04090 [Bacteroidales bacterium]